MHALMYLHEITVKRHIFLLIYCVSILTIIVLSIASLIYM